MQYSIETKDRIYVECFGFLPFVKNFGKDLSNKYSQKLLDSAKKSEADAIKADSKRSVQKTAEATGDLISNKIAHTITKVSKASQNNLEAIENQEDILKEVYISP